MPSDTASSSLKHQRFFGPRLVDMLFRRGTFLFATVTPLVILVIVIVFTQSALLPFHRFGWHFITTSVWDVVHEQYGVLFAIAGTAYSSLLALLFAVPVSLGAALFLAELSPRWLREPLSFLVEMLAAVPSIVYGLWGVFVLVPLLRPLEAWLGLRFGFLPIFQGPPYGIGMLAAGLVLAIMIIPYITAVSREVIRAVPPDQREAAYALGATHWEALRGPVLRYARSGILGAVILGLGRALGETMAVTMVIGNRVDISASLFSPAYTMPSLLANEYNEATGELHLSSLVAVALILLVITFLINGAARLLIWRVAKGGRSEVNA